MVSIERINVSQRTDVGRVRSHNEDYVGSWQPSSAEELIEHGWLYIVADGVGGAEAGEVASRYATEQVITHFLQSTSDNDEERLRDAIQAANDDVRALAAERMNGGYMATTIVVAHFRDENVLLANVGDSRGYHWRDGILRQVTKDQSLVAKLVEEGAITEEEARVHPRRNVILSSLGSSREPQIDIFHTELSGGDKLLLCSDGLTGLVDDFEIAAIIEQQALADATQTLIDLANERGGSDNITVSLFEWATEAIAADAKTGPVVISAETDAEDEFAGRNLWVYTFILAFVEAALILLIWYALRV
jgi:protein phosphatase